MLAIRLRVRPCSARCSPRSVGRVTSTSPSPCSTFISRDTRSWSSPRGPATRTTSGSIETVTVSGMEIGCLPMRLMTALWLPDVGHDLAVHARRTGLVAGHDPVRGRHDRGAHAAENLGYL